eukprot:1238331-Amphidinium_carterae.1
MANSDTMPVLFQAADTPLPSAAMRLSHPFHNSSCCMGQAPDKSQLGNYLVNEEEQRSTLDEALSNLKRIFRTSPLLDADISSQFQTI